MPLSVGDKLGRYEVLSLLGEGGMGEVYKARDTTLKRGVALKVLPASFLRDTERMARFQREAEAWLQEEYKLNPAEIGVVLGTAVCVTKSLKSSIRRFTSWPKIAKSLLAPIPRRTLQLGCRRPLGDGVTAPDSGDADAPFDGKPRDGLNSGAFPESVDRPPAKCLVRLGPQARLGKMAVAIR